MTTKVKPRVVADLKARMERDNRWRGGAQKQAIEKFCARMKRDVGRIQKHLREFTDSERRFLPEFTAQLMALTRNIHSAVTTLEEDQRRL